MHEHGGRIRVIHRQRIGGQAVFARVSQLTYSGALISSRLLAQVFCGA